MKHTHRFLLLAAVLLVLFALTGCGKEENKVNLYKFNDNNLYIEIEGPILSTVLDANGKEKDQLSLELVGENNTTYAKLDVQTVVPSIFVKNTKEETYYSIMYTDCAYNAKDNTYFIALNYKDVAHIFDDYKNLELKFTDGTKNYKQTTVAKVAAKSVKEIDVDKLVSLATKHFSKNSLYESWSGTFKRSEFATKKLEGDNLTVETLAGNILLITTDAFGKEEKFVAVEPAEFSEAELSEHRLYAHILNSSKGDKNAHIMTYWDEEILHMSFGYDIIDKEHHNYEWGESDLYYRQ